MTALTPGAQLSSGDLADDGAQPAGSLWPTDTGTLREPSRRALVQLLRGPYLSAERHGKLWNALLNDEQQIRSRLADLFLELVTDQQGQFAFARNAESAQVEVPKVMRTATLTFMDTAMLLHLRQLLLHADGNEATIVGQDEITDQLQVYSGKDGGDAAGFARRVNASWVKLTRYGLLAPTSTEGRSSVSPVLRLVFDAQEITAVQAEYARLAADLTGSSASHFDPAHPDPADADPAVPEVDSAQEDA